MSDQAPTQSTRPPAPGQEADGESIAHLVIAWSSDQPELVGYVARVDGPRLLGRGDRQKDDPAQRLSFVQMRPSAPVWGPPLAGARLSRRQLVLAPLPDGALEVESVGRCPMFLNGAPAQRGIVRPGDTILLQDTLVLLAVARPSQWFRIMGQDRGVRFAFGEADPHGIVGESPVMWELRRTLSFAAQSGAHVLLHGESGTGKELAARAIHALSPQASGPFISRNAATLPEGLVDAELFGNAKGYPNPTMAERPGLIGEAHGGTLFLDEVGEMRPDLQAHLLRVLDRGGEYQRLGDAKARRSTFRLVAATNRPVESLKHDLAARFAIRVKVPGLQERREDIPFLWRHALASAKEHPSVAARFKRREHALGAAVEAPLMDALLRHEYSHHMRELHRLLWVALMSGQRSFVELTAAVRVELGKAAPAAAAEEGLDRRAIEAALAKAGGKIAPAARLLGLKNRYALYRLMRRHGMQTAEAEAEAEEP